MQQAIAEAKKMLSERAEKYATVKDFDIFRYGSTVIRELIERLEALPQPSYSQGGTGGTGGPNTFPIYKKLSQEAIASIEALPRITK